MGKLFGRSGGLPGISGGVTTAGGTSGSDITRPAGQGVVCSRPPLQTPWCNWCGTYVSGAGVPGSEVVTGG